MRTPFLALILLMGLVSRAQVSRIDSLSLDTLHDAEMRLIAMGINMIQSPEEDVRMINGRNFLITLSRSLRITHSYFYRFDSLKSVSILYSPDNNFRVITWNIVLNQGLFHYYGVIQLNPDYIRTLKDTSNLRSYYPLIDRSAYITNPLDTVVGPNFWWGAAYYSIVPVTYKKKTYYTLFGWNGAGNITNKKVVDVLSFENNAPVFGAPIFDMKDARFKKPLMRMVFEFNNSATMLLRYSAKKKFLVYENLVPPHAQDYGHPETYLPDGSYEYMIFKKGIWEKQSGILRDFDLE